MPSCRALLTFALGLDMRTAVLCCCTTACTLNGTARAYDDTPGTPNTVHTDHNHTCTPTGTPLVGGPPLDETGVLAAVFGFETKVRNVIHFVSHMLRLRSRV